MNNVLLDRTVAEFADGKVQDPRLLLLPKGMANGKSLHLPELDWVELGIHSL